MQLLIIRLFDILFAIIGLSFLSPVFIVIVILGIIDTGKPIFYQQRVGQHRKPFTLIKFRTMKPNTASVGTHLVDSNAITPLGSFLRKTKLDELPQLINVLLGTMSLVGARPCLPNQSDLIKVRTKHGVYNHKPGITGLAQINNIDMSTPKKLAKIDATMHKNLNICYYFSLILKTIIGQGAGDAAQQKNKKQ
ncbi:sugar transferase [Zooshikella sp. RANM57]|uniref:sugar transferase n=1 Tax=Zooshikella sp. RANM57 TaxID=3425863 RepID=UPI003D6F42E8